MSDIHILHIQDKAYPSLLKEIPKPPEKLYVRGNINILSSPLLLAVVGSRKASSYGQQAIHRLLPIPTRAGLVIVSGLAYGIDSLAHGVAIQEKKPTVAVVGTGVDDASIYPRTHRRLANDIIAEGGALVSEYPPGTKPLPYHFPARNRIIAGLSRITLIIQASEKSGSLITARLATECNREVAAVPGMISDPLAYGPNQLIRDGAHTILEPEDLLLLYGLDGKKKEHTVAATISAEYQPMYNLLSHDPVHIDILTEKLQKPAAEVSAMALELELQGYAHHVGGMKYIRTQ